MSGSALILDVRPWGGPRSDVEIVDGRITAVGPHRLPPPSSLGRAVREPGGTVVQGRGRLLLPSFSDVHVHLDSTRIGLPFRPHTGGPGSGR